MWASLPGPNSTSHKCLHRFRDTCPVFLLAPWKLVSLHEFFTLVWEAANSHGRVGCQEGGAWELSSSSQAPVPSLLKILANLGGAWWLAQSYAAEEITVYPRTGDHLGMWYLRGCWCGGISITGGSGENVLRDVNSSCPCFRSPTPFTLQNTPVEAGREKLLKWQSEI